MVLGLVLKSPRMIRQPSQAVQAQNGLDVAQTIVPQASEVER